MRRTLGFTFVEVIVCLAIILTLAAIAFAVLTPAKKAGLATVCIGNLHQLHTASMIYRTNHDGQTIGSSVSELGLPHDVVGSDGTRPLVGEYDQWKCPAPKSVSSPYWPHYDYVLLNASAKESTYLLRHLERFGESLPLYSDLNHNNHALIDLADPRTAKRVIYVDLQGKVSNKMVRRSFAISGDFSSFGFDL